MWQDIGPEIRRVLHTVLPAYQLLQPIAERDSVQLLAVKPDGKTAAVLSYEQQDLNDIAAIGHFVVRGPANDDNDLVYLKRAALTVGDVTSPVTNLWQAGQDALGGRNALTSSLVGGALGGLAGYGLGSLYDRFVPRTLRAILPNGEETIGETNMAGVLARLGAGAGALPGLMSGTVALANGQSPLSNYPWAKVGALEGTGALFSPSIPVDAFNRVVWSDVMQPQNPFGTRSAWGDNSQPMHTPPSVATMIGGLVSAAGAGKDKEYVSPWDVAQVAARVGLNAGVGALAGAASGVLAGKALGLLAGLRPEVQNKLQQSGTWAGLLTGIARSVF